MFDDLKAPFPPDSVSWRVGSMTKDKTKTRPLAYIDARDVMGRLDDVVGPENWQCDYVPMQNGTTCCRIELRVNGEWIGKANGAGATDVEGEKGAYSDAFKRAAVLWGIGQYLYDVSAPWVEVDEWKQIKKEEMPKLRALLERNGTPAKSAYAANKDGEWKTMIAALRAAVQTGAVAEFLTSPDTRKVVSQWPDKWQDKWAENCERAREQAAAA